MRRNAGFSLIELLVAAAVLGIVMVYLTSTFTTTQRTHITVDQVSEAQQNLRVISELIERDLRHAGYLVPKHAAVCGVDATNGADTLWVSNSDALQLVSQLQGTNPTAVKGGLGARVNGVNPGNTIGGLGTAITVSQNWLDVQADGPDFAVGGGVIVVNRDDPNGRAVCGIITAMALAPVGFPNGATLTVDFLTNQLGPIAPPIDVVAIPAHVYRLTPPVAGAPFQLHRDGVLLANDVEDLQLNFFVDADDDGVIEAGEFFGDNGETVGDGVALLYDSAAVNARRLRQVEINLVTATRDNDPNPDATATQQQITGNRAPASIAAPDRRRRRVYSATVRMRNV